jgi:leucyl aminopeptidase
MTLATIIFANDSRVKSNKHIELFIENSSAVFSTLFHEDKLIVVIKETKDEKQTYEQVRMMAGAIARELSKRKVEQAIIDEEVLLNSFSTLTSGSVLTAFVEGWNLGTYQFLTYKSKETAFGTALQINHVENNDSIHTGEIRAEAMAFSRDLMNEVPNVLNPETFPKILAEKFADTDVNVKVFGEKDLEKLEMNGILTVGRGSKYAPAFVELHYCGDETQPLVALVGKGVTFDTGGISLKGGRDLSDMRMDMGGAAAVAGAIQLLAKSKAKVNVVALIQIVENMPDNESLLPGEVIRYKNGHTVQVGNTDAEGRLILADGLIRAGELKAEYVVNIATLTGAIANALGSKLAGVFGDEQLSSELKAIGDVNGDFVWPMPLVDAYDSYLKSDYADFSNISSKGEAGAITAGLFLRRFVPDNCKWLHVDMAGVMESQENGYYTKSATGFGARLLADFTEHVSK